MIDLVKSKYLIVEFVTQPPLKRCRKMGRRNGDLFSRCPPKRTVNSLLAWFTV